MRKIKVTVTDENGVVLDVTTVKVKDSLRIITISEGNRVTSGFLGELTIGAPQPQEKK
jgi:hypothetical protein